MNAADLVYIAARIAEALAWVAAIFAPGLVLVALHHRMRQLQKRRAWAASVRDVAADYAQHQPLLDDVAHIVDTYADRIAPLYGKGE